MNKGRAMRRMVAADGLRLVDVLGRADVMQALDAQLQPVREVSPELMEARRLVEELRNDNAQLEKDGAALALAVRRQDDIISELRRHVSGARPGPQMNGVVCPVHEFVGGLFAFAFLMVLTALLFVGAWHLTAAVLGG
jgi:hypothetical protein